MGVNEVVLILNLFMATFFNVLNVVQYGTICFILHIFFILFGWNWTFNVLFCYMSQFKIAPKMLNLVCIWSTELKEILWKDEINQTDESVISEFSAIFVKMAHKNTDQQPSKWAHCFTKVLMILWSKFAPNLNTFRALQNIKTSHILYRSYWVSIHQNTKQGILRRSTPGKWLKNNL